MSISSIYPLSERFSNLDTAIIACRTAAYENGYGLRLSSKKINRHGLITSRQLVCDRAGIKESQSKGIRRSGTIRCNCKFALWIRSSGDDFIIDVSSSSHNHPPSKSLSGHSSVTCLKKHEKESIIRKSELGMRPRTILAELRQEGSHATVRGVYNCLAKHKRLRLGG